MKRASRYVSGETACLLTITPQLDSKFTLPFECQKLTFLNKNLEQAEQAYSLVNYIFEANRQRRACPHTNFDFTQHQ